MKERLQKLLSRAGVASRRGGEQLIKEGRVTVNGKVAVLGQKADPRTDAIKLDGKRLQFQSPEHYFLLNKPEGFITSKSDPQGRSTVFDLLPKALRARLITVGRLDYETEGLLILTDDGEFANRVAHPRYGCSKTYEVKVKGRPSEDKLDKLRKGVVIDGYKTSPARITALRRRLGGRHSESNSWWEVAIQEGRTRQIREMFARIGFPVQRLRRVAIGTVRDPHLPKGSFRELTLAERTRLLGRRRKARFGGRRSDG